MKVIVTGGTGFIGSALVAQLVHRGHEVTVIDRRIKTEPYAVKSYQADLVHDRLKPEWFEGADAIIHLAGAPLVGRLWTRKYRQEIIESRIQSAKHIMQVIERLPEHRRPRHIISASAIGIYGDQGDEVLTEQALQGRDFLADVCKQWENVWQPAKAYARVVSVRTAIVLHPTGGLVGTLAPLFRTGLGAVLGSGMQWVSWVSLRDLVQVYLYALETPKLEGALNAATPHPLRNRDFMMQLAQYYRRPLFLRVPAWVIRIGMGTVSDLVLFSQRVKPRALLDSGFVFEDETIAAALKRAE